MSWEGFMEEAGGCSPRPSPRASPSSSTNVTIHYALLWDTARGRVSGSRFFLIV